MSLRPSHKKILCLAGLLAASLLLFWAEWVRTSADPRANLKITDQSGLWLAQEDSPRFGWRTWVPLSSFPPSLVNAVLLQEDRRFYYHPGIDPIGLSRALWANLRAGRFLQGGSTISQQLAKILLENWREERIPRNLFWKAAEALVALDCELHWTKREILERYLNNVYLGHRLYGFEIASQVYFKKSSRDLTAEEAKLLAGHLRRPNQARARLSEAVPEPLAPHVLQMVKDEASPSLSGDRIVPTTLDAGLQNWASQALRKGIENLRNVDPQIQGALVVLDTSTSELKALVGSADFRDGARGGQVNHALALRQPGSTLKPFTYFLAFLHHREPATLVLDAPYHFYLGEEKSYTPNNFDRRFHGIMPIREALANSFNIPAVLTLEELGTSYYLNLLHQFGFSSLKEAPSYYGLSLTLGSGAVSLLDLTNAYATLARGGEYRPVVVLPGKGNNTDSTSPSPEEKRAAFLVTSILTDPEARRRAFGDADLMSIEGQTVAVKTGTSHEARDVWAVGYSPRFTVGVWMGHTDNSPMPGFSGAEAAVPVWHQVMAQVHKGLSPLAFAVPPGLEERPFCRDENCSVVKTDWSAVKSASQKADPRVTLPKETFRFIAPVDGDHFLIDPELPKERQQIYCEVRLPPEIKEAAQAGGLPIRWMVDGTEASLSPWDAPKTFLKLSPGKHEIRAKVGDAQTRLVRLTLSDT
ncbi:MAG: transglycosylase domain-containing protein [bacterium]